MSMEEGLVERVAELTRELSTARDEMERQACLYAEASRHRMQMKAERDATLKLLSVATSACDELRAERDAAVARDTGSLHSYGQELARALDQVDSLQQTLDAAVARAEKAEQCLNLITAGEIEVKDEQNAKRIAHLERRLAAADALAEFVKRASEDSCTTSGEYGGPGCFYCDVEDGHTKDCEAAEALRAYQETRKQPKED